jgi:methylase of polypeptide subunit release factors
MTSAGLTDSALIHTLIGKFVYLYYLRHRGILSDQRLSGWDLSWDDVAGRGTRLTSFTKLFERLNEWLNGSVFPLDNRALKKIGSTAVQRVAAVFAGDSPSGQMYLDFQAYDFSHIPIETLSVIYEQFLHLRDTKSGSTAGKEQAAYYTPIPVVNFIIDRMDEIRPLRPGMRVLDAACGSGAFLVQCYRKRVEDRWRDAPEQTQLRPTELRELLVKNIFGLDVDGEACRVAELSLILTLLDYVDPPDLTTTNFKFPNLSGTNIIESNAFDEVNKFVERALAEGFDWLIGNPPWKDLKGESASEIDKPVLSARVKIS